MKDVAANVGPSPAALGWFRVGIPVVLARPDLTNATDSGVSPVDDITNFDDATPARVGVRACPDLARGDGNRLCRRGADRLGRGDEHDDHGHRRRRDPPLARLSRDHCTTDGGRRATFRPSPALTITVLTTPPRRRPRSVPAPGEDTGEFGNDLLTNSTNPGLQVSAAPAPYYRVYLGGTLVGASYNTNTVSAPASCRTGRTNSLRRRWTRRGTSSPEPAPLTVTIDAAPPTASLCVPNVTAPGGQSYTFSVTYRDLNAVARNTLNDEDVTVTAPGGASLAATLVSVDAAGDGSPRTATYRITPPGGYWDEPDNGTYQVVLAANQVQDVAGNWMPAGTLGLFTVAANGVGTPDLLPESDTGASASDNTTKLNNSTAAKALKFSVINTHPGDLVSVFADGVLIGTAAASGVATTVTTDGATALTDGATRSPRGSRPRAARPGRSPRPFR